MDTKECSLPTRDIHVDDLVPNDDNVNEMTEKTISDLTEKIREHGCLVPLNVIPIPKSDKYLIFGGEHRWIACKLAGMLYVPCVIHSDAKWQDKDVVDLESFNLNSLHGKLNQGKFIAMYKKLAEKMGAEKLQKSLVLTEDARKYLKNIESQMLAAGATPKQVEEFRQKAGKMKNPADLSRMLQKFFKDQATQIASNSIIVQYEAGECVIIKANIETYISMRKLVELAVSKRKDVNEFLAPVLKDLAMRLEKEEQVS